MMNLFFQGLAMVLLLAGASLANAQQATAPGVDSNPYNSPIKRANPNSRQGTVLNTPGSTAPSTVRPPTLENGGIGNGQPTRQQAPVKPAVEPGFNPPPRGTSDRDTPSR